MLRVLFLLFLITYKITCSRPTFVEVGWIQSSFSSLSQSIPTPCCDNTALVFNGSMYNYGGYNDNQLAEGLDWYQNVNISVLPLGLTSSTYVAATYSVMQPVERTAAAWTLNPVTNEFVMFGGFNQNVGLASSILAYHFYFNDLWAFNPDNGQWRELQSNGIELGVKPCGHFWSNFITISYLVFLLPFFFDM